MKKLFAILAVAGFMAACNSGSDEATTDTTAAPVDTTTVQAAPDTTQAAVDTTAATPADTTQAAK